MALIPRSAVHCIILSDAIVRDARSGSEIFFLNQILTNRPNHIEPFIDRVFPLPLRYGGFSLGRFSSLFVRDMPTQTNVTVPRLWLASSSPRRSQLLQSLGLTFKVIVSAAEEEDFFGGSVENTVKENARRKAHAVLSKVPASDDIVIAADTLVAQDDQILSKPATPEEALKGLRAMSGGTHRVLTGLAIASASQGMRLSCTETKVRFRKLSEEEMRAYVSSTEPYDKAGGYGIQGMACLFVDGIEGSYSNIMGLPSETLLLELQALTHTHPLTWLAQR